MKKTGSLIQNNSIDDLSERIEIFYSSTQRNNVGDFLPVETVTRCKVWAKVLPLSSRRLLDDSEISNEINYQIVIRYRSDILPDDLIKWRGRIFRQTAPPFDAESRKIFTVLNCVEVLPDGTAQSL